MPLKMGKHLSNLENDWEKRLKIQTCGREDYFEDDDHHPYEACNYEVLQLLVNSNYITPNDLVIDYGSGKGRVAFYLAHQLHVKVTGIENEAKMYQIAMNNLKTNQSKYVSFKKMDAREYKVSNETVYFFFNPFPVHVLRDVVNNIIQSYYVKKRKGILVFYYPSVEYMEYLLRIDELEMIDMIDCQKELKVKDEKEYLILFQIR